jgi:hypothetical protein
MKNRIDDTPAAALDGLLFDGMTIMAGDPPDNLMFLVPDR